MTRGLASPRLMKPSNAPRSASRPQKFRPRFAWSQVGVLAILLLIPACALGRLTSGSDIRLLLGMFLSLSVFAFFAYRSDKRRAEAGEWRVPEATLHAMALLGGWPGAFLAQRVFRHKTSKLSFLFIFWCVVGIHEYLAVDFLLDWRFSRGALQFLQQ